MARRDDQERARFSADAVVEKLAPFARPLASDADLDPLIDAIGDARCVLLGEASHGTSEFYTWRTRLSRRLILEKGFHFIAVEGDWPDCYRVNRYVKQRAGAGRSARQVLDAYERWPTWMWANQEVEELAEWLAEDNRSRVDRRASRFDRAKVGFYGLDVYSLWESMRAVVGYLDRVDPEAAHRARNAYECFAPFEENESEYAHATLLVPAPCEEEVVRTLADLRKRGASYYDGGEEEYFNAEQNALVARNAEHYYRTMVRGGAASWNVRDGHMFETLERLMALHGESSKAIVWEHNTHVGDARYTDMAADGMFNIGQLARERIGEAATFIVGFSSHRGSVIAGDAWGSAMRSMTVPPGRPGSYEDLLHRVAEETEASDLLLLLRGARAIPELAEARGHRAIGVVYRPRFEQYGNYVPTVLPRRYDALLFIDRSAAVRPIHPFEPAPAEVPDTYPSGM